MEPRGQFNKDLVRFLYYSNGTYKLKCDDTWETDVGKRRSQTGPGHLIEFPNF